MVQEGTGNQLKSKICNFYNPWKDKNCQRPQCMLCKEDIDGSEGKCWNTNVVYQIKCLKCQNKGVETKYFGEAGKSTYTREKHI